VSRQAFDDWRTKRAGGPTEAELVEEAVVAEMCEIHFESVATYGQPRMTPELAERGLEVNHKSVERLMRTTAPPRYSGLIATWRLLLVWVATDAASGVETGDFPYFTVEDLAAVGGEQVVGVLAGSEHVADVDGVRVRCGAAVCAELAGVEE